MKKSPKRNKIPDQYFGLSTPYPDTQNIKNHLSNETLFLSLEERQKKDLKTFLLNKATLSSKYKDESSEIFDFKKILNNESLTFKKLTPLEHLIFSETIKYGETSSVNIVESTKKSKQLVSRVIRKLLRNNVITYTFSPIVNNLGLTMKMLHIKTKGKSEFLLMPKTEWVYALWKNDSLETEYFMFLVIPSDKESNQVMMRYINRLLGCSNVVDVEDYDVHDDNLLWNIFYNPSSINRKTLRYDADNVNAEKSVTINVPYKTGNNVYFTIEELEFARMLQIHGNLPLRQLEEKTQLPYRRAKEIKEKVTKELLRGWVSLGPAFNYVGLQYFFDYSTELFEEISEIAKILPKAVISRLKGFQDYLLLFIRIHPQDLTVVDQIFKENGIEPEKKMSLTSVIPGYLSYSYPLEYYDLNDKKWSFSIETFLPSQ